VQVLWDMWGMPVSGKHRTLLLHLCHSGRGLAMISHLNDAQMLSYETQLQLKQRVVEKAYQAYSELPLSSLPPIQPTIPSPKQYAYRTKITPHFDAPPKTARKAFEQESAAGERTTQWETRIGFDQKGRRTVMDIEVASPINRIVFDT
jgi:tRNA/tmRNA/rRNA uracil-C5-methylase (TrmA/RlmC/RlmD family)